MDSHFIQHLREKGWTEDEINKAINILYTEKHKRRGFIFSHRFTVILFWILILVAIIGNIIVSVALIPFFLILTNMHLFVAICIVGLTFGIIFSYIIRSLQKLDYNHRVMGFIFIPTFALINIYVIVNLANNLNATYVFNTVSYNSLILGIMYVFIFTLPHYVNYLYDRKRKQIQVDKKIK